MRLHCTECGKSVSTEVPNETIVRAVLTCPECVPYVFVERLQPKPAEPRSTLGRFLNRFVCALRGHCNLLETVPGRVALRCLRCGHASRGWVIGR